MKQRFSTVIFILLLLIGFSLLLYPAISNYVNNRNQTEAIAGYEQSVSGLSQEDYSAIWEAAGNYNRILASNTDIFPFSAEKEKYSQLLDLMGNGIMGYLEIGSIDVKLPVYHGTGESVLSVGVGHLEESSLPVGGTDTHCVLSGHRGLPSSKLFTNLVQLKEGDVFVLHVLDKALAYRVDQVLVVEPDDTDNLEIVKGMDYCTLVTCTPYGLNTHRLYVRGVRINYDESVQQAMISADAKQIDPVLVAPFLAIPVLSLLSFYYLFTRKKRKHNKQQDDS